MTTGTETGVMGPQAKDCQLLPEGEGTRTGVSPGASRGTGTGWR